MQEDETVKYYAIATEEPDDINMVAGLIRLGVLVEEPDVHHYDYCDHSWCHEECVPGEQVDEQVQEAVDEATEEKEEDILEDLGVYSATIIETGDAVCGCHSKDINRDDGLLDVRAGEYYLINTDRSLR